MSKADFKLNLQGLNELMKSSAMQAHLHRAGQTVAGAAGGDYSSRTYVINYVAIENIFPNSPSAAHDNYKNNTLVKALGSAGLSMK